MLRKVLDDIDDPTGEKKAERTKNNGFNKPQVLSEALRKFLNLGPEDMLSRSAVTKAVNVNCKIWRSAMVVRLQDIRKKNAWCFTRTWVH